MILQLVKYQELILVLETSLFEELQHIISKVAKGTFASADAARVGVRHGEQPEVVRRERAHVGRERDRRAQEGEEPHVVPAADRVADPRAVVVPSLDAPG